MARRRARSETPSAISATLTVELTMPPAILLRTDHVIE
jgi:hypothetical protein